MSAQRHTLANICFTETVHLLYSRMHIFHPNFIETHNDEFYNYFSKKCFFSLYCFSRQSDGDVRWLIWKNVYFYSVFLKQKSITVKNGRKPIDGNVQCRVPIRKHVPNSVFPLVQRDALSHTSFLTRPELNGRHHRDFYLRSAPLSRSECLFFRLRLRIGSDQVFWNIFTCVSALRGRFSGGSKRYLLRR